MWSREEHERIFARDGLLDLIDGAVYTSEIDWTKPHPEAFRAALDAVGVAEAATAVFVGDRLYDDIHGAANVGHAHHPGAAQRDPGRAVRPGRAGNPTRSCHRLAEVLDVVDSWR